MKKFMLIASAAAMAVSMPALAQPGNGKGGGGQGGGRGQAAQVAKPQKMNGNGNAFRAQAKPQQAGRAFRQAGKAPKQQARAAERSFKAQNKSIQRQAKAQNKAVERSVKAERKQVERMQRAQWDDNDLRFRGVEARQGGQFCPPGLARKNNGCLPPGQANKIFAVGEQLNRNWYRDYNIPTGYRPFYNDTDDFYYRYDDNGYIYRVDRNTGLVSGLIPLLGGGFSVGQVLPAGYDIYNVPLQYRDMYYDTDDYYYRYGDGAIYQVDPQTRMIQSVVALLTGDNLAVGQPLPAGYDVYNVPYPYRDRYYDTNDYMYRYADGYIYQADPQTQIITAIIDALI